jgi:hypothetical protein
MTVWSLQKWEMRTVKGINFRDNFWNWCSEQRKVNLKDGVKMGEWDWLVTLFYGALQCYRL